MRRQRDARRATRSSLPMKTNTTSTAITTTSKPKAASDRGQSRPAAPGPNTDGVTIGIDLGDKKHAVCAIGADGEIEDQRTITNHRESLRRLSKKHPGARIVMEVGSHSPWTSRFLRGPRARGDRRQRAQAARDLPERPQERRTRRADAGEARAARPEPAASDRAPGRGGAARPAADQAARHHRAPARRDDQLGALHAQEPRAPAGLAQHQLLREARAHGSRRRAAGDCSR